MKINMEILFMTFIDILNSLPQRSHHIIDFLKERYDLTVLFCRYNESGVFNKKDGKTKYIGIPVKFYDLFNPMTLYNAYTEINKESYDICIAQGPWMGIVAVEFKKSGKINLLAYEDIDYFPDFFQYEEIYNSTRNMEKFCIENADVTFSVNRYLIKLREEQTGITPYYIPNGVKFNIFQKREKEHEGLCLIFSGSLEHWSGLELPIKVLPALRREFKEVYVRVLGKGHYEAALKKLVADLKIDDYIHFYGKVEYNDLPYYFSMADIGLCTLFPTELINYSFPLKAVEYMAAGLPVVATDMGELGDLIKKNKCGITITYSYTDLLEKLIMLLNNPDKLRSMGSNGLKAAEMYDWKNLFEKELNIILQKLE
ncbi:glycosyltransferase family 4 protein [Aceticella autotrophica]|nr:glycosyltransferase family 4 protein [Aceticella autotrophica]